MNLIHPSYEIITKIDGEAILKKLEMAGRVCWASSPKGDSAEQFCKMILGKKHESVIEHESLTIKFIVSRSFTHELVRHRLASFSQESTRYCNYNKKGLDFIIPTWMNLTSGNYKDVVDDSFLASYHRIYCNDEIFYGNNDESNIDEWSFINYLLEVEDLYNHYIKNGRSPQEARAILPNCLKTTIVMTANLREWKLVLKLRTDKSAHPEMRQIMCPLLEELKGKVPVIFDQIGENSNV